MAVYAEILAGYEAAAAILDGSGAIVENPSARTIAPSDPDAMAPYSVVVVPSHDGVSVYRYGEDFLDLTATFVEYPCSHEEPDFAERFAVELTETVNHELRIARQERADAIREHGPGGIEAWDQIRRIG